MNLVVIFIGSCSVLSDAEYLADVFCDIAELHPSEVLERQEGQKDVVDNLLSLSARNWEPSNARLVYDCMVVVVGCLESL